MKRKIILTGIIVITAILVLFVNDYNTNYGYSHSAGQVGATGSPADGGSTCDIPGCHNSYPLSTKTGWITSNIPTVGYTAGHQYLITCTATYAGRSKFGFNCGASIGTITSSDATTQTASNEVTHTSGSNTGTNGRSWSFYWTAPATGSTVTFYAAFNCADGNLAVSGDYIYTSTLTANLVTPTADDAGISTIVTPSSTICSSSFTPVVTLKNFGTNTLTSATINYKTDTGVPATFAWTGSLATSATTNVTLPAQTTTAGSHTFTAYTSNPNGTTDTDNYNDTTITHFNAVPVASSVPFAEGFEGTTFPPSNWSIVNPDNSITWVRTTAAHQAGSASTEMDNYNYNGPGQTDDLITPPINCTSLSAVTLTFGIAYTYYNGSPAYYDSLRVLVSNDCGQTYTSVYYKGGSNLASLAGGSGSEFVPTAAQWRTDTVSLNTYAGSTILVDFRSTTEFGNDLYIDNINISAPTGIADLSKNKSTVELFPNPTTDLLTIRYNDAQAEPVNISLYSIDGKNIMNIVSGNQQAGMHNQQISLKNSIAKGMYFVKIIQGSKTSMQKIIVQ
ncbi:MAG TPA: choice-of-anchor V domain-containing protein [Bacteroidia bacterium]|nr:choice-of-anchor V domain-containing protein [Bacteroidia bacterium]